LASASVLVFCSRKAFVELRIESQKEQYRRRLRKRREKIGQRTELSLMVLGLQIF